MSLLKPTPGEVMDRISILSLKQVAYSKKGRDISYLREESHELSTYLKTFPVENEKTIVIQQLGDLLNDINHELWKAEDDVRSSDTDAFVLKAARKIASLNDLRNRTIRDINKEFKSDTVEEKIYQV